MSLTNPQSATLVTSSAARGKVRGCPTQPASEAQKIIIDNKFKICYKVT